MKSYISALKWVLDNNAGREKMKERTLEKKASRRKLLENLRDWNKKEAEKKKGKWKLIGICSKEQIGKIIRAQPSSEWNTESILERKGFYVCNMPPFLSGVDLIAGDGEKRFAIEVKSRNINKFGVYPEKILATIRFAMSFQMMPIIIVFWEYGQGPKCEVFRPDKLYAQWTKRKETKTIRIHRTNGNPLKKWLESVGLIENAEEKK